MANIGQYSVNDRPKRGQKSYPNPLPLDTMETSAEIRKDGTQTKYVTDARQKYEQTPVLQKLMSLDSPFRVRYEETMWCRYAISIVDGQPRQTTCKRPWCRMCNNDRTARLMRGYLPQVQTWKEIAFLTLTKPACYDDEILPRMNDDQIAFRQIQDTLRKRDTPANGLRARETTINVQNDTYHIHYHFLIDSMAVAKEYKTLWLKMHPQCNPGAQNVKFADTKSLKEIFKYPLKMKLNDSANGVRMLDTYFRILSDSKKPGIRPFGNVRKVQEEMTTESEICLSDGSYLWRTFDWMDILTGKRLTGYVPDDMIDLLVIKN